MSIPVQFTKFKAAGIYRVVYDKSTVLNQDAEIMRLVVGYSEKGPFNVPTYVKNAQEFKALYGDVSKKLEKRGVYFHRMALQALGSGPILCLNLKNLDGCTVDFASASTEFPEHAVSTIDIAEIDVKKVYDTTRFWTLDEDKLNEINCNFHTNKKNDRYINFAVTDSVDYSRSFFMRKASGNKVSQYNITVSDWYKSTGEDIPEYLIGHENNLISDYFAEIYVFKGQFTAEQVLASDTLKNYFTMSDATEDAKLILKPYVIDGFGDRKDTLDALFLDETSGAVGHYVGCILPYFTDKFGAYQSLNILFNSDADTHHMMMSFNVDLLDRNTDYYDGLDEMDLTNDINIDLSGKGLFFKDGAVDGSVVEEIFNGSYTTSLFNNVSSPVIAAIIHAADEKGNSVVGYNVDDEAVANLETSDGANAIYGTTVTFVANDMIYDDAAALPTYIGSNCTLGQILSKGDMVLGESGFVFVQDIVATAIDDDTTEYTITFSGTPYEFSAGEESESDSEVFFIRIDGAMNQEVGIMEPMCLMGYDYHKQSVENFRPESNSMKHKLDWHAKILDVLNDNGIRTALLNRSEIDYRYIVDTFETYVESGAKKMLSMLAKEKESAFAILNFPSVRSFVKCPYSSFTNANDVFNVQYVVDGCNKKKASAVSFSLPSEVEGASFCAFYTPLKFTDGYVDNIIPSAALVSNLFMEKYMSRQPYYIIAGPNYGAMSAPGLVGPDYHYSKDELNIIEPYGVNCMVYRPGFGTFINANQTAKQTPKSALSSVNVRELVIYLQDEIEKVLQAYQWEFNNPTTRNAIKDRADVICERVKANGGLQAYLNIMDESNNTPDIIDNEMAVLSTHIEPGRGMGKMIHELTIHRTGGLSSTIKES